MRRRSGPIAGVAAGLGEYLDVDPNLMRLGFVMLTLLGGSGVFVYLAAWLLLPTADQDPSTRAVALRTDSASAIVGAVVLALAAWVVLGPMERDGGLLVPLLLVGAGVWLLSQRPAAPVVVPPAATAPPAPAGAGAATPPSGTAPATAAPSGTAPATAAPSGTAPATAAPSATAPATAAPSGTAPATAAPSGTEAPEETEWTEVTRTGSSTTETAEPHLATDPAGAGATAAPSSGGAWAGSAQDPGVGFGQVPPGPGWATIQGTGGDPARHGGPPITALTLAAVALVVGLMLVAHAVGGFTVTAVAVAAAALLVIGVGLVASAFVGRAVGLIPLGLLAVGGLAVAPAIDRIADDGMGARSVVSAAEAGLQDRYELGVGKLVLDLREVDPRDLDRAVEVDLGIGDVRVVVPPGVRVEAVTRADAGALRVLGREREGLAVDLLVADGDVDWPVLRLDASVGLGALEVRRG